MKMIDAVNEVVTEAHFKEVLDQVKKRNGRVRKGHSWVTSKDVEIVLLDEVRAMAPDAFTWEDEASYVKKVNAALNAIHARIESLDMKFSL